MQYIIYGANRVAKDFLYIFNQLEIAYVVDNSCQNKYFEGYKVWNEDKLCDRKNNEQIIVCDFNKEEKLSTLSELGLKYEADYLYEEDFFQQLDTFQIPDDRKIAIWGTGKVSKEFCEKYPQYVPQIFIDTYPKSENFRGKNVIEPDNIDNWRDLFVIVCVEKDTAIREKLAEYGLTEKKDYTSFQTMTGMPSGLLRQTIFDISYYDLDCSTMLNHLEILHNGDSRCCCTTFVRQNLDNIMKNSIDEVWHSNLHKILCLSTENRTYSFCDKTMCPLFVARKKEETANYEGAYKQMSDYPETLALGYDATCNLNCATCRKSIYVADGKERAALSEISNRVKKDYLPHCKFLILAGDGEVFLSPAYKDVYQDKNCDPKYIRLLSNGMLFNQNNWEKFVENKTGHIMLTVSVDAATKATYEKIRRNGNFDILKQNMQFASELRKSGQLKYFRMNFVVQKENYKEMPMFVQWGEELGVDEVFFTKILNWGTYSDEEFEQVSMMEKDGVTPKDELQEIMQLPAMQSDIVDMGTIQFGHKIDEVHAVENYYMWELEKRGGKIF